MIIFVSRLDKVEYFWLFLLRWIIHPAEASQHEQILLGNHRIVTEAREDAATCVNLPFCTNKLYRNVCVCMCPCLCVSVSLSVCVCQQLQSLTFTTWPDLHPTHLANLVHTHISTQMLMYRFTSASLLFSKPTNRPPLQNS